MLSRYAEIRIEVDELCLSTVWVPPDHPFVEYEREDEWWLRRYGVGRQETRPAAFQIGNRLVMHPDVYEEFRRVVEGSPQDRLAVVLEN